MIRSGHRTETQRSGRTTRTNLPRIIEEGVVQMLFLVRNRACLLVVVLGQLVAMTNSSRAQGRPASPVVTAAVVEQEVRAAQTFVGSVMPEKHAIIGSAVDGRVVELRVEEGDRISAKGTLAVLLTRTITMELKNALGEWSLRQSELEELENGSREEEKQQAKALRDAAQASYTYAKKRFDRIQQLVERGNVVSQEQFDEAQSSLTTALEMVNDREAAWQLAVKGPREERIAQARARVDMQETVVEKLDDQVTKHTIISRFAGYVSAEHTEIGQWVKRGDPVAEVVALDYVDVVVNVLESHVPHIRIGDDVRVEVPAIPGDRLPAGGFIGKVAAIVPQGDLRSRTFPVKVRVKNDLEGEQPLLKAGMLARAAMATGSPHKATLVPKDAIVLGGARPMVYVTGTTKIGEKTTVSPVPVQLGGAFGRLVEISGELKAGQAVVVLGNERLRPMQEVIITRQLTAEEASGLQPDAEAEPVDADDAPAS